MRRYRLMISLVVELGLMSSGTLMAARPAWHWAVGVYSELSASYQWKMWLRRAQRTFEPGRPAFWLRIPDCGIDTLVLYGATERNLRRAPVFLPVAHRFIIAAHRDRHFRSLAAIRPGAIVELTGTLGEKRIYRVFEVGVLEKGEAEGALLQEDRDASLVLVTCYPFRYVGPAPRRFIVRAAELVHGDLATDRPSSYSPSCVGS